jgi:hypothetical protein
VVTDGDDDGPFCARARVQPVGGVDPAVDEESAMWASRTSPETIPVGYVTAMVVPVADSARVGVPCSAIATSTPP